MNDKNKNNENPWDEFFAPIWESTTPKQRPRPSNGKEVQVDSIKSQGGANLKKKIVGNETDKKTKLQRKIEKTSANVNKDTSHKNNNEGFVKKDETISNITGSRTSDSIIDKGGLKTNKLRQKDLSLKYPKAVSCSLEEFNGKSVSLDSKKLEQSINKYVPTVKKPKKISEPTNIANKSINKGKDNGTINRSNDISHNDVSKANPRRKTTPDLSLKYPKAVSCSLEEIFGETIFPNSKKPDPAIRMPSGNKREECAKKPDLAVRMPSGSKREEYAKKPDPAIRMHSGSKREECAKKPDFAIRMPSGSKREECAKKPDPNTRIPGGSKREECAKKPDPATRMSNSSKREECVSVSTHHKPKDLTHLKTLEDYQREAEAMGHKLPSDRDPPDTIYYPRIKRLLDPASLKCPITSPNHPMNVIKYLATVPPRTNPVQLNKIKRVQYPNFVTNKSTSRIGTKGQINRQPTEKKVTSLSKMNSDTRRTFSKSISELHKTPNARNERLTPRGLSIVRESPQVRDKVHVTHKGSLQSTNRKRIAHEESSVRDPSMIKRRLTNNTLPPTQQMSKKRPMHFSPEPSRPAKRHQIRRNREGSIDEMDVSSIIQSIFRRGRDRPIRRYDDDDDDDLMEASAVEVFSEEARSSKIGRKEDEEQERLDQQRRLLKTKRFK
ncbi:hypothetical protein F8M41_008102 [Gigaspora margarita]|uniref:Protein SPT2 homolog n=1 Tax=Gigaspora margarita TaxID=4874 RepID=A0A8H4A4U4_GIGMA|nr:hypothetical protein F8M41_008102 [Gigaspora margarita]